MARGQDPVARTGGQVDPGVAQSMQQNKQLANTRLLSAMQESGATQRANAANQTQLQSQSMQQQGANQRQTQQIGAQEQMQAADLAAQDKRAAEAERAQRQDRAFSKATMEVQQRFQADQSQIQRDYNDAVQSKEWDRADKIYKQMEEDRDVQRLWDMMMAKQSTNAVLSATKMAIQKEQKTEKVKTVLLQKKEEASQNLEMRARLKENVKLAFSQDKRMDLNYGGGASTILSEPIGKEPSKYSAMPLAVVQDQIAKAGSPISLNDLRGDQAVHLEQSIAAGKVSAQDVRSTLGVLEAALEETSGRAASAEDGSVKSFWKEKHADLIRMRNSLENLKFNKTKIKGSDQETVGSRVRYGVGQTSLGDQVLEAEAILGTDDADAVLGHFRESIGTPGVLPTPEYASPYMRNRIERINSTVLQVYPEIGGNQ